MLEKHRDLWIGSDHDNWDAGAESNAQLHVHPFSASIRHDDESVSISNRGGLLEGSTFALYLMIHVRLKVWQLSPVEREFVPRGL